MKIKYHIYDCNFKNIFDMYPQGILDIARDIILKNYPEIILDKNDQKILKQNLNEILESDNYRLHFKKRLANEFVLKNGKKFVCDTPIDTMERIIINFEFQSYPINYNKETIFNMYQASLHNEHQKYVFTVVFSMVHDKHEVITHKINQIDGFTMLIISLKALNQKQTLNNINYKIKNNIPMSDKEKALFLLIPLMDLENKVETLIEAIHLTSKIKNLSSQEYEDIMRIQLNFAKKWFDEETLNTYGGTEMVILTKEAQEHIDNLLSKEEREKIREEAIGQTAINMIKKGFTLKETCMATGLTKEQINKLCASK